MSNIALLGNREGFTVFQFGKDTIRFRAPYSLERYTETIKWDNGYLVAMAKYAHNEVPEEEYSMYTGMESVYTLLNIDRGVPEFWGSKYDVWELLKLVLKKIQGTDVELLLKESGLIR